MPSNSRMSKRIPHGLDLLISGGPSGRCRSTTAPVPGGWSAGELLDPVCIRNRVRDRSRGCRVLVSLCGHRVHDLVQRRRDREP